MKLRADKSQEEDVFADSEKLLIFLPKAKFLESNALLSLFSDHFLLSGPVVVFFSDLALLSFFQAVFPILMMCCHQRYRG